MRHLAVERYWETLAWRYSEILHNTFQYHTSNVQWMTASTKGQFIESANQSVCIMSTLVTLAGGYGTATSEWWQLLHKNCCRHEHGDVNLTTIAALQHPLPPINHVQCITGIAWNEDHLVTCRWNSPIANRDLCTARWDIHEVQLHKSYLEIISC